MLAAALGIPLYGIWIRFRTARRKAVGETELMELELKGSGEIAWRGPLALVLVACLPLLVAASIVVVPSGMGGMRVSQIRGTIPGTLYPGVHFVTPLVESVETFSLRDHLFTADFLERAGRRSTGQRAECAVARGPEHWPGGDGSLSPRSQQAFKCAGPHAPAG